MSLRASLATLGRLMAWDDERAKEEFAWIAFMSRMKYDGYHDYLAGVRFAERLITWLRQFRTGDRETAYGLIRQRLIFISAAEMRRLVERFYPRYVQPALVRAAAEQSGVAPYRLWASAPAVTTLARMRRQTLFMGLSDGARIDIFRRANAGLISNEQTVLAPLVDHEKWRDLGDELKRDPLMDGVAEPKFNRIYLIDDLTASGTTLLRLKEAKWKGKLVKLRDALWSAREELGNDFPIAESFDVNVHHYIATTGALASARALDAQARASQADWFSRPIHFDAGLELTESATVRAPADAAIVTLCEDYYDPVLENEHSKESGDKDMRLGYGKVALTLVLEHNTPNNTIPLLWADTPGAAGTHAMTPLFRRRSRHA